MRIEEIEAYLLRAEQSTRESGAALLTCMESLEEVRADLQVVHGQHAFEAMMPSTLLVLSEVVRIHGEQVSRQASIFRAIGEMIRGPGHAGLTVG